MLSFISTEPKMYPVSQFDLTPEPNAIEVYLENQRRVQLTKPKVSVCTIAQSYATLTTDPVVVAAIRTYLTEQHSTTFPAGVQHFQIKQINEFNYSIYLNYRIVARMPLSGFSLTKTTSTTNRQSLVIYDGLIKFVPVIRSRLKPLTATALPMVLVETPRCTTRLKTWWLGLLGASVTTASVLFYIGSMGV